MIILHHCQQSRSMRVMWLLHELGAQFDVVIHPLDKSLRAPEYLARHPVGRVPALEMDGETLWESGAILEILSERYFDTEAGRALGRMPGDPDRADWLIWLHFAETVSQHVAALTQQHIMLYDDAMRSPVVMQLEARRIAKCYDAIEARLTTPVERRDHLLTSGFSVADIAVGQAVYMARHFASTAAYPALSAWYARITERPAFAACLPPEGSERLYARDFYPAWDSAAG